MFYSEKLKMVYFIFSPKNLIENEKMSKLLTSLENLEKI